MNSRIIPVKNIRERKMIRGQLMGIFISGSFFGVLSFDFLLMKRIRIPVIPPETTPPIPRIDENPKRLNCVINT